MLEREERMTPGGVRVVLMDSVSFLVETDAGVAVVCGSHGGASSGEYAARRSPGLLICNDAGVGKDSAGIAGLLELESAGVAAAAVSADSSRIGDAADTWKSGVVSHTNARAGAVRVGMTVQEAVDAWAAGLTR